MKDLKITKSTRGNVEITPQTDKAKKVFVSCGLTENDTLAGQAKKLPELMGWAVSHDLSVDCDVPIIIQPLLSPYVQKFSTNLEGGFARINEMIENSNKNLAHLDAIDSFAKKQRQLLYRYFSTPVADGKVYYQIVKVTKTTATVKICGGICLDEYVDNILGEEATMPLARAKQLVEQKDALNELFSRKGA